jgi:hypothetical protein
MEFSAGPTLVRSSNGQAPKPLCSGQKLQTEPLDLPQHKAETYAQVVCIIASFRVMHTAVLQYESLIAVRFRYTPA